MGIAAIVTLKAADLPRIRIQLTTEAYAKNDIAPAIIEHASVAAYNRPSPATVSARVARATDRCGAEQSCETLWSENVANNRKRGNYEAAHQESNHDLRHNIVDFTDFRARFGPLSPRTLYRSPDSLW